MGRMEPPSSWRKIFFFVYPFTITVHHSFFFDEKKVYFNLYENTRFSGLVLSTIQRSTNKYGYDAYIHDDPKYILSITNMTDFGVTVQHDDLKNVIVPPKSFLRCIGVVDVTTVHGTSINYGQAFGLIYIGGFGFNIKNISPTETRIVVNPQLGG